MRNTGFLLVLLGVLFGPFYYLYFEKLSGGVTETWTLGERASRWTLPDGAILRTRTGLAYKPLEIALDPANNGHRLRLEFDMQAGEGTSKDARNGYLLSLLEGDLTIFERSFDLAGTGTVKKTFDAFEVLYPGRYVLLLEEAGTPALAVSAVRVELVTGVESPRMWLVWCGVVLLAFGIAIIVKEMIGNPLKR